MTAHDVIEVGKRAGRALVADATRPDGSVDLLRLAFMHALVMRETDAIGLWARHMAGGNAPDERKRKR